MSKNLQLLRNGSPFPSYATAKNALNSLTAVSESNMDGSPILARYTEGGVTKTLLGIAHSTGDNGQCKITIIGDMSSSVSAIKINGETTYVSAGTATDSGTTLDLTINGGTIKAYSGGTVYTYTNTGATTFVPSAVTTSDTVSQATTKVEASLDALAGKVGFDLNYDSTNKKIYLKDVKGSNLGSGIDASDFIKDGMISSVTYDEGTHVLTITWNTEAGIETTNIPLSGLVDTYTTDNLNVGSAFTPTVYQTELTDKGASAITSGETTSSALHKIETTISALTEEVLKDELVTEKGIEALATVGGVLGADGSIVYTPGANTKYISGDTSISDALNSLDGAIANIVKVDNDTITKDEDGTLKSRTDYGLWQISNS